MFEQTSPRRLFRSRTDRQIAGVCGGLAAYMGVDPTVVRIVWVLAAFATFPMAPIFYVILAALVPQEPTTNPTDTYMI
ncbi:MAG: PspC domain-containing protein [Thermomicrobiales bacterium]